MKTKLTLSIEETVVDKVKTLSKKRKQSVSSFVENYLRSITGSEKQPAEKELSFTESFRKKFPPPARQYSDKEIKKLKEDYIMKKYGS